MKEFDILIEGKVQGVGFRAFVKRYADSKEIKGLVKNLPNSQVQILCICSKTQLDQMLKVIENHFDAKITILSSKNKLDISNTSLFEIVRD